MLSSASDCWARASTFVSTSAMIARLVGANREFIDGRIPHLYRLLADTPEEVFGHGDVCIVAGTAEDTIRTLVGATGRVIVDLVRLPDAAERRGASDYVGVAW